MRLRRDRKYVWTLPERRGKKLEGEHVPVLQGSQRQKGREKLKRITKGGAAKGVGLCFRGGRYEMMGRGLHSQ